MLHIYILVLYYFLCHGHIFILTVFMISSILVSTWKVTPNDWPRLRGDFLSCVCTIIYILHVTCINIFNGLCKHEKKIE